jgi:hypothetical protein
MKQVTITELRLRQVLPDLKPFVELLLAGNSKGRHPFPSESRHHMFALYVSYIILT